MSSGDDETKNRDRIFAKLSQEDDEFRKKILDLHKKLLDVDGDSVNNIPVKKSEKRVTLVETAPPKPLDAGRILKPALKNSIVNSSDEAESISRMLDRRRLKRMDLDHERKKHLEQLRRRSERIDEVSEDDEDEQITVRPNETTFLNRLRIRRRSIKLLSFLSGKSADKSHEERASRLLKMYMPEKCTKGQNTISIHHHTSRSRRFWKLRSRRKNYP